MSRSQKPKQRNQRGEKKQNKIRRNERPTKQCLFCVGQLRLGMGLGGTGHHNGPEAHSGERTVRGWEEEILLND